MSEKEVKKKVKSFNKSTILLGVTTIIVCAGLYAFYIISVKKYSDITTEYNQFRTDTTVKIKSLADKLIAVEKKLKVIEDNEKESANITSNLSGNNSNNNILFDIQMASYQLHVFHNPTKANYWLEKARAKSSDEAIKTKITTAINKIAKADEIDLVEVINKLQQLRVDFLEEKQEKPSVIKRPKLIKTDESNTFDNIPKFLAPYITISKDEDFQPSKSKLHDKDIYTTKDNFSLAISLTQWSLTSRLDQLFHSYINEAISIVKQSNFLTPQKKNSILHSLSELDSLNVDPILPDLSNIISLIQSSNSTETESVSNRDVEEQQKPDTQPKPPSISEEL